MKQNRKGIIIGVTGGIGTGKSSVVSILKKDGFNVIDADEIYKRLVKTNANMIDDLIKNFGNQIVDENKNLKKAILADIAFCSKEKVELLNNVTHKYVVQEIDEVVNKLVQGNESYRIAMDVPIPIKRGFLDICDEIWVVIAKKNIRIERILKRNPGLAIDDIKKRINMQLKDAEYLKFADKIIYNDYGLDTLEEIVKEYLE